MFGWRKKKREAEPVFSSDNPFVVKKSMEDGVRWYRTFLPPFVLEQEKEYKLPVKLGYDEDNLFEMTLYLPLADIIEKIHEIRKDPVECIINLWIWFEDGTFIINYPEECNLDFDPKNVIMCCRVILGNTGFDSEEKDLVERFGNKEEICRFVLEKLMKQNIVEIQPNIVMESGKFEGETIFCTSNTVEAFTLGVQAIKKDVSKG